MALIPIVELGVSEAYAILTEHFGVHGLPPLGAIENEDWAGSPQPLSGDTRLGTCRSRSDRGRR